MEPENPALDRYVLAQARSASPSVLFLPTASGDTDAYVVRFYQAFAEHSCRPSHLSFFRRTPDLRACLLSQDVIYVGGGNTKSMLGVWREWGLPEVLREAWEAGVVLAGVSAGAICWFEQGLTDSYEGDLRPLQCLGFLAGSCCPHYHGEADRRPTYHHLVSRGDLLPGYAVDDSAALHFKGDDLHRIVTSRRGATAYRVTASNGSVEEEPLPVGEQAGNQAGR